MSALERAQAILREIGEEVDEILAEIGEAQPSKLAPTPGAAISIALSAAVPLKQDQAALVGESPSHWTGYIRGSRNATAAKMRAWLVKLKAGGHPLRLTTTAGGCVAARMRSSHAD